MVRPIILAVAAALAASPSLAATPKLDLNAAPSPEDNKVLADGFAPFDQAARDGWEATSPEPLYLSAGNDMPAGAPLMLQPGSYRIVVLCDCNMMEVTLLRPDNQPVASERSDDRRAMYSLDVPTAGPYLAGIDMDDCPKAQCDIGVKIYRKTGG